MPLFPDEQAATAIVKSVGDDPRDLELRVSALGDPFKAMRKAAGEGAAGFQLSPRLFTDEQVKGVLVRGHSVLLCPRRAPERKIGADSREAALYPGARASLKPVVG